MRDYKFRAWDTESEMWLQITAFDTKESRESDGYTLEGVFHDGDYAGYEGIVLMQWTGLYDRNGKEIYEGDIAKSGKRLFVAKWNDDIASFVWEPLDGESSYPCFNVGTVKNMEIVGNVFENPELLEGED